VSDQSREQTGRPEHKEMAVAAKFRSAEKSVLASAQGARSQSLWGKADVAGEGKSTLQTVEVRAQASQEESQRYHREDP